MGALRRGGRHRLLVAAAAGLAVLVAGVAAAFGFGLAGRPLPAASRPPAAFKPVAPPRESAPEGPGTIGAVAPPAVRETIPPGRRSVRVPILEYHYIRVNPNPWDRLGYNLSVTPADFSAQMGWLEQNGYHPIDLVRLRAYLQGTESLPSRPVVLTFDDGYEDFYSTAYPILREHHFVAVAYIVPGFFGRIRYLTPDQVVELDHAGIEIASHTVHHADLTKLDAASLQAELVASRGYLEQLLGHPVLDFCYPSGRFNARVEAAVQAAGYQSATSELPGVAHSWSDRFTWARVRVMGGESLAAFTASLGAPEPAVLTRSAEAAATPTPVVPGRADSGFQP